MFYNMLILLRLLFRLDVTTIIYGATTLRIFDFRVAFLFILLVSIGEESIERKKGYQLVYRT